MTTLFYSGGAIALVGAILAVTGRNAVHALLCLMLSLLAIAVAVFALGAPYAAILEVIIYAGAIMMLFLFVIILIGFNRETTASEKLLQPRAAWIMPVVLCGILLVEWIYAGGGLEGARIDLSAVDPGEVGVRLFNTYILGVELASMLLLSGLVGAFHLARRDEELGLPPERSSAAGDATGEEAK